MPRRDAQVHKNFSRLMQGARRPPPLWYGPMLAYPPTAPLPLKLQVEKKRENDLPRRISPSRMLDKRPAPIEYPEDRIRQQFFKDHPFEAFRPRSIAEGLEVAPQNPINGPMWERLVQRGRNPLPEDAIQYALNLHTTRNVPLSDAYRSAVHQFRALRAERQIMLTFAVQEAEAYGAELRDQELSRLRRKEEAEIEKWKKKHAMDLARLRSSKKWQSEPMQPEPVYTGGLGYMERLRQGGGPLLKKDIIWPDMAVQQEEKRQSRDTFRHDVNQSQSRFDDDPDAPF